jgi:flagellar protein FliO/FliZ
MQHSDGDACVITRSGMISGLPLTVSAGAALAAVLGLIWLLTRAARFSGLARVGQTTGRILSVEAVTALDTRRRLHLVRCGERRVLLLTGGQQDVVVGWLGANESAP